MDIGIGIDVVVGDGCGWVFRMRLVFVVCECGGCCWCPLSHDRDTWRTAERRGEEGEEDYKKELYKWREGDSNTDMFR